MAKIERPKAGDKAQIKSIVSRYHVGTSTDEIIADIDARINNALQEKDATMTPSVRKAWHDAAIKAHEANRKLYRHVMRGY